MDPIQQLVELMMQNKMTVPDQFQGVNRMGPGGKELPNAPTAQDIAMLRAHSSDGMIRDFGDTFGPQYMQEAGGNVNSKAPLSQVYEEAAPYAARQPNGGVPLPRERPEPGYEGFGLTAREDPDDEDNKREQTEREIEDVQKRMGGAEQTQEAPDEELDKAIKNNDYDAIQAMKADGFFTNEEIRRRVEELGGDPASFDVHEAED